MRRCARRLAPVIPEAEAAKRRDYPGSVRALRVCCRSRLTGAGAVGAQRLAGMTVWLWACAIRRRENDGRMRVHHVLTFVSDRAYPRGVVGRALDVRVAARDGRWHQQPARQRSAPGRASVLKLADFRAPECPLAANQTWRRRALERELECRSRKALRRRAGGGKRTRQQKTPSRGCRKATQGPEQGPREPDGVPRKAVTGPSGPSW